MRHDTAIELRDGSGWHYASLGSRGGYPLGYCAEHPGHPSEMAARLCYSRYMAENRIRLNAGHSESQQFRCEYGAKPLIEGERPYSKQRHPDDHRCGVWTQDHATVGSWQMYSLCAEHMTVECVVYQAGLDKPAGDSWHS